MKITVKWEKLHFNYALGTFTTVHGVWQEIVHVIQDHQKRFQVYPTATMSTLISLCLRPFGPNAKQMRSVFHIMIDDGSNVHKLVPNATERSDLLDFTTRVRFDISHFIVPAVGEIRDIFKYPKVLYNPLDRIEARRCLKTLVMKIHVALAELHSYGLSHTDIRPPNICFNKVYAAVLIDMDRCAPWDEFPAASSKLGGCSCMYKRPLTVEKTDFNSKHLDYLQLGWLVAWVLSEDSNYHGRKWTELDESITRDKFVSTSSAIAGMNRLPLPNQKLSSTLPALLMWHGC